MPISKDHYQKVRGEEKRNAKISNNHSEKDAKISNNPSEKDAKLSNNHSYYEEMYRTGFLSEGKCSSKLK